MKKNHLSVMFLIILPLLTFGQANIGIHTAFSEYLGPQMEFSLEAPVYKNFSLAIRGSAGISPSFQYIGGLRYSPRLFSNTRLKLGADFGSFVKRNNFNETHKMHGKIRGLSIGIQQGLGKNWSLLGEFSALEYFEDDWKSYLSGGIHVGLLYNLSR